MIVTDIGHIFKNDFILLHHDKLIKIDLILSFKQMWSKYPDISLLYPDFSMYIICDSCEISASTIIGVSTCPFHLLRLNLSTRTLTPVDGQVSESGMLSCFR